ncbi:MAG: leucine--tRNA ligase [Candidatus Moranbacteria bacterium]|nr:leucine--tRNA ligase [Candidatus Moranbacteria bacterium]
MEKYTHKNIEKKWQEKWQEENLNKVEENSEKEKYYVLDMFPYPSGDGLHMGHTESYTASDIIYRFKKMQGYNVLHPQGFDSFGLPAENYAIKTGVHPKETTKVNTDNYLEQMKMLGLGHDLDHLVYTSDPSYYKWTQYLFGKFFENNLVVQKTDTINWCSSCNTGIANEQVEGGKCERCKTEIEQRDVPGWFFRITDFADELIDDLDKVDWPEHTKKNQKAWIGKSEGAKLKFKVKDFKEKIEVFTTRPDTLFGVTYMVLAPEHELLETLKSSISNFDEIEKYQKETQKKTELDRMEGKEKTGVELKGIKAINPANGEEIPIFIADYVLAGYGTGAIMAVPTHDERDFEFAKKFDLEIRQVVAGVYLWIKPNKELTELEYSCLEELGKVIKNNKGTKKKHINFGTNGAKIVCSFDTKENLEIGTEAIKNYLTNDTKLSFIEVCFTENGSLINSGKFDGLTSGEAKTKITEFVGGEMTSTYRLRDWSISRQRYWGCPIPIVYSPEGEAKFVGEENLPWLLPEDVDFVPTGEAPLKNSKELHERVEKLFGKGWTPEVDTMDTFVDSAWYFLRYPDTENENEFCSVEKLKKWFPVDIYIGGAEHTYMHLLYARFFVKAMKKIGLIDFDEPFMKLRHQGMVLDKEGVKMSKSKGNIVNPNEMVKRFGADAVRNYMMFAAPLEDDVVWDENNIVGVYRFLEKVWKICTEKELIDCENGKCADVPKEIKTALHKTIKKVTEDIESLSFNTAISQMMIFSNKALKHEKLPKPALEKFLILLAPFAPHMTEEIWREVFKNEKSIFLAKWPEYNPEMIKDDVIELIVQVNGKVRDKIKVEAEISEEDAKVKALESEKVKNHIKGKEIRKVIFVKGRLISFVV